MRALEISASRPEMGRSKVFGVGVMFGPGVVRVGARFGPELAVSRKNSTGNRGKDRKRRGLFHRRARDPEWQLTMP